MGTIADKLTYLAGTKNAIKQAIIDKGVEVADIDTFRSYATKIADISGGGGGTPTEWEWPADWPDITSIVESDTDNEYPYKCIWLLNNDSPTFDYTFGSYYVKKVLLSDGTTYTGSFIDHEWGTNTDTSIVNYRWIILYMSGNAYCPTDGRPISITYNNAFLNWYSGKRSFLSMFDGCYSLQTIPLLDTNNGTDFSYMFKGCSSLQTIPSLNTSGGKNFSGMFQSCNSLQTISSLNTSRGTDFSKMFNGCSSLQTIPLLDTSSGTNFSNMFNGCPSLQTIPLLDTSSGTSFNQMFVGCTSLQTIPSLNTSRGTNFSGMFNSCFSLQTIPSLDTSSGTSFTSLFNSCYSLQTIPSLNTSSNGTNFSYTFSDCSSLQHIDATSPTSHNYNFNVYFSNSNLLSKASIINIFNNLPTKTGQTITITSATNAKLTTEEKEIATNKGWTISVD